MTVKAHWVETCAPNVLVPRTSLVLYEKLGYCKKVVHCDSIRTSAQTRHSATHIYQLLILKTRKSVTFRNPNL